MHHLLQMADERQHQEHGLDKHAILPLPTLTQFQIAKIPLRGMKTNIAQDNHALFNLAHEPLKAVIRDLGRATRPPHHQAILVEEQTEFAPDNPAVIREACAADLLGAAAFADGMDQRNPVRVDDAEHGWGGQESLRPVLMRLQKTKEPGALGEAGKQGPRVARQPAIEGTVAHAFEGMQ